jgi:hypothetical protein
VKEYKSFFDKLSKEKAQFEEQANSLEQENSELMAEVKKNSANVLQVREENTRLKSELGEIVKKFEWTEKGKTSDRDKINELEELKFEQTTKISSLTSELEILKHYIENQTHRNSEVSLEDDRRNRPIQDLHDKPKERMRKE